MLRCMELKNLINEDSVYRLVLDDDRVKILSEQTECLLTRCLALARINHMGGATGNVLMDLQNAVIGYADAIANDAQNPQPSYNLDGQMVSRQEWRAGLLQMIKELNMTINALNPYQVSTKQVI